MEFGVGTKNYSILFLVPTPHSMIVIICNFNIINN